MWSVECGVWSGVPEGAGIVPVLLGRNPPAAPTTPSTQPQRDGSSTCSECSVHLRQRTVQCPLGPVHTVQYLLSGFSLYDRVGSNYAGCS